MDKQLEQLIKERNVILIMKFGSHLYGCDTPASDQDFMGIFIPTPKEILLQRVPKHISITPKKDEQGIKNSKDDIDITLFSLQYFIELCLKGETVGVDMLHGNEESIIYQNSKLWEFIQGERKSFYSKNLSMLTSYLRKQISKYGAKGSRIADARKVKSYLESCLWSYGKYRSMEFIWKGLPEGEHIRFVMGGKNDGEEFYQVCGKKLQKTSKIAYCISQMESFIEKYGARALLAEKNEGIDFKAISHAMRYGLQLKELFQTGDIKFPLKDREFLLQIKNGELDYKTQVTPKLEAVIEDVEQLAKDSKYPEKAGRKYWEDFVADFYAYIIKST